MPLNVLNPLARVHHQPAGRVSGCHGQIAGAHALVERQRLGFHAVPLVGIILGMLLLAAQAGLHVNVQIGHQIWAQAAGGKLCNRGQLVEG